MSLLTAIHGNSGASLPPSKVTLPTYAKSCSGGYLGLPSVQYVGTLTSDIADAIETGGISVTLSPFVMAGITGRTRWESDIRPSSPTSRLVYPAIYAVDSYYHIDYDHIIVLKAMSLGSNYMLPTGTPYTFDLNDINTSLTTGLDWATVKASPTDYVFGFYVSVRTGIVTYPGVVEAACTTDNFLYPVLDGTEFNTGSLTYAGA